MPVRKLPGHKGYKIPHVDKIYKTKKEAEHVAILREYFKNKKK